MGFVHPEHDGVIADLSLDIDQRGNIRTNENKMTSTSGIFAAGDATRGQSLVVWELADGREAARGIDQYLTGQTILPSVLT